MTKTKAVLSAFTAGLILLPAFSAAQPNVIKHAGKSVARKATANAAGKVPRLTVGELDRILTAQIEKIQADLTANRISNANLLRNLNLLNDLAASIRKDPAIIFTQEFAQRVESYANLGIPLMLGESLPAVTPPGEKPLKTKDVNAFINTFETSFNRLQAFYAQRLNQPVHHLDIGKMITSSKSELMLARGKADVKWNKAATSNKISWGYPGVDRVTLRPATDATLPSSDIVHVLTRADAFIKKVAAVAPKEATQLFDLVFSEEVSSHFQLRDRAELLHYASAMNELVGTEFFSSYVRTHNVLPVVQEAPYTDFTNYRSIADYASNRLLKQVSYFKQNNTLTFNSPLEQQNFLLAMALLPEELQNGLLQTVIHGEYDYATWLLTHPAANPTSLKILDFMSKNYHPATPGFRPPARVEVPSFVNIKASLELRLVILDYRIKKADRVLAEYQEQTEKLSAYIQDTKQPTLALHSNNPEAERDYYRKARAILDNKITRLQKIREDLVKERNTLANKLKTMPF